MKNVLLICSKLAEERTGGVQTRIINYAKNSEKLGIRLTILSLSEYQKIENTQYNNSKLIKYPKNLYLKYPFFLFNIIKKYRIESIHILEGSLGKYQIFSLFMGNILKKKTGISLYGGEIWDVKHLNKAGLKLKLKVIQRLASVISVNSQATAKFIPIKYQDKINIVYPGVNMDLLNYELPPKESNKFELLYVGRIFRRKGLDDIIKALSIVKTLNNNIHLNVIGPKMQSEIYYKLSQQNKLEPTKDSEEYFKLLSQKYKVADKVSFLGEISDLKKLASYYNNCDIFIMAPKITNPPSGYESFGCVYLEAALFKKPVLGTKHYGVLESVVDGKTGLLVPENNPKEIASAIKKLILNDDLRIELGENGYNRTISTYTDLQSTEQLLKPYL